MTKFCRSRADVLKAKKKQLIDYHEPVNLALGSLKEGIKGSLLEKHIDSSPSVRPLKEPLFGSAAWEQVGSGTLIIKVTDLRLHPKKRSKADYSANEKTKDAD